MAHDVVGSKPLRHPRKDPKSFCEAPRSETEWAKPLGSFTLYVIFPSHTRSIQASRNCSLRPKRDDSCPVRLCPSRNNPQRESESRLERCSHHNHLHTWIDRPPGSM